MTSGGGTGGQAAVVHVDVVGRFEEFERRINELESQAGNAGESAGSAFSGKFSAGLAIATAGAVALAGAVVGVAASSFNLAQEAAQNVDEFQSKLGATREEAEMLGGVAEQVFGNNWTGSLEEAGQAVANVRKEISDLADEDLQKVTEGTVAIAETFEQEQGTVAAAVAALMDATGASAEQATDAITLGFQRGLDSSGDLLDTISEYSPQFKEAGLSVEQAMSLLETGAAKGALGVDKAADTMAEFRKIVQAGGDDVLDAFQALGLGGEEMMQKIGNGQMTIAEAFTLTQQKLKGVDDSVKQQQIGVALMGTLWEDMGSSAVLGLDLTKTKLSELGGATDSLNQRYTSLNDFAAGMWRKIQVAMLPVGKELLGMANEAVPYLQKAFDGVAQKLPGMIRTGIDAAKQFGTTAVNVYNSVRPAIDATITMVEKLSGFISRNREVLIPLTAAVGAGAAAFGLYRAGVVAVTAAKAAWTVATTTATTASIALRAAVTFLTGPIGLVITAVGLLVGAGVALYRNWDEIKAFAGRTWGAIKEIVANAINGAVAFLRGVDMRGLGLDIVQGLVNGILAGPRLVLAAARGLGSAVINGVKGILNIQSPSRVMIEMGEYAGQGLALGLAKTEPDVQKAAAHLGTKVREGVVQTLADGLTSIQDSVKASEVVRDLFGSGEAGLAAALKYYGVATFDELSQKAGSAATLIERAYSTVIAQQRQMAESAREAAEEISKLVDEQIKAANAQYANVQAAADMAYRQSYGVGEGGLVSALSALTGFTPEQVRADVERALTELERLNPGAAAIVGRAYADVLAEQRQAVQEQQSLWNLQAEGNKRAADTAIAEADRLSEDGDWSGAARVLEDALDDLYAAAEGGEDAADAINAVTDALNRLAAARAGLKGNDRTLADWRDLVASGQQDPMMDGPVEARGTRPKETPTVVSPPRVAPEVIKSWDDFSKAIAKAEWVRETTDELKAMDATQLANAKTLAISSRDLDRYNLVLAEEERRAKAAAEGSKLLADLTREAARAAGETQRPYADQIAKLTELRGVVGVNQVELEKLILKFQDLQAQAEKQQGIDKMVGKINEFSNYARQAIPIVTGAMQALGGVTGEVADQWASDLGSMVGDLTNIATAIAKGDWIGAAVQGLMSIFNWFNRNAEAASKAAKATADYNNQFKFAQGTAGGNYGTRTTGSYTTGFLFWSTTHYTEQIDQMKKDLALAAENGFVNGMKSGFNEALAKSDFSLFEKSLKTSVGRAVLDGLTDSFNNQAIIAKIIGPAIDAYLKTGDTAALRTAIQAASGEARKFYDDVLAPIAQEFGLLGTDAAKPAPDAPNKPESDIKTIKVEMPTVSASLNFDVLSTLATVVERAAPRIETGGLAMVDGANRLLIAADRFERVVTGLELTPQGFRS